ncbi:MAG: hypothetical protein H6Q30_1484 [Bacteroidetes bacterium]|nr:hypothetical protein [Bacteroidota bacterium]
MEEHQTVTKPEPAAEVKPMSFTEKLANIFSAPGELFENVRLTGKTPSNWVIPTAIMIVVAIAMQQLIMSNPSLADQTRAMVAKATDERLQKAVESGSMTPEQAEQQREQIENFSDPSSMLNIAMRVIGIVIFLPAILFLLGLVYWLLGKTAMHATSPYMKVVEVVGLTFLIGAVESIVTTVMAIGMDSLHAGPHLAAMVQDFDLQNKLHAALAKVNVFTIWSLIVTSIGLSKLFQRDLPKVLVLVFALWILWSAFTVLTGFMNFGA